MSRVAAFESNENLTKALKEKSEWINAQENASSFWVLDSLINVNTKVMEESLNLLSNQLTDIKQSMRIKSVLKVQPSTSLRKFSFYQEIILKERGQRKKC